MERCCISNLTPNTTYAETESGLFTWNLQICLECGTAKWLEVDSDQL